MKDAQQVLRSGKYSMQVGYDLVSKSSKAMNSLTVLISLMVSHQRHDAELFAGTGSVPRSFNAG